MQRRVVLGLGVLVLVAGLWLWSGGSSPESDSLPPDLSVPSPAPRGSPTTEAPRPAPSVAARAPVERTPHEPDLDEAAAVSCEDLHALGELAGDGALSPEQIACLETRIAEGSDREHFLLTLLAVQSWTTDREAWERYALQLASIDDSPDLHVKLALHYASDDAAAALHHIAVARKRSHLWPEDLRERYDGHMDKLQTKLCAAEPELCTP